MTYPFDLAKFIKVSKGKGDAQLLGTMMQTTSLLSMARTRETYAVLRILPRAKFIYLPTSANYRVGRIFRWTDNLPTSVT